MGTKQNPGKFDCYANAADDEPMFILLSRDLIGEYLTSLWAAIRVRDHIAASGILDDAFHAMEKSNKSQLTYESPKIIEAMCCAKDMRAYRMHKEAVEASHRARETK